MESSKKTKKKTKEEEEIEKAKEENRNRAEQLVLEKFPKKIIELETLLKSELFREDNEKTSVDINIPYPKEVDQTKQNKPEEQAPLKANSNTSNGNSSNNIEFGRSREWIFPNGKVPSNKHIVEIMEVLKPLLIDMIKDLDAIELGISLMMPKIEDGNNFGVQVQGKTLETIKGTQNKVLKDRQNIGSYFSERARLVTQVARFPHSDDYRRAIQEHDKLCNVQLINILKDLHKHYTTIHDIVTKNLNKIKQPKADSDIISSIY